MLHFVARRDIPPRFRRAINIPGSEGANLARTTTREPLKPNPVGDDLGQAGECLLDHLVRYRRDQVGFSGICPVALKTSDCFQTNQ
jgi:hypothetical protein